MMPAPSADKKIANMTLWAIIVLYYSVDDHKMMPPPNDETIGNHQN